MVKKSKIVDKKLSSIQKNKTYKRRPTQKQLKKTRKKGHNEEGGGIFDIFRTAKKSYIFESNMDDLGSSIQWASSSTDPDSLINTEFFKGDHSNTVLVDKLDQSVFPGGFTKETFLQYFSLVYGLGTDDWNNRASKSRIHYLTELTFVKRFWGNEDHRDLTKRIKRHIGYFFQYYFSEGALGEVILRNKKKGSKTIFMWNASFSKGLGYLVWGDYRGEINPMFGIKAPDEIVKILKDKENSYGESDEFQKTFMPFTVLLIYIYTYYQAVQIHYKKIKQENQVYRNKEKTEEGEDNDQYNDTQNQKITDSMETLLNKASIFRKYLLENEDLKFFFMSVTSANGKFHPGLWVNHHLKKGAADDQDSQMGRLKARRGQYQNLYFLTNQITKFKFVDTLYNDQETVILDSASFMSGKYNAKYPKQISPILGKDIDKDFMDKYFGTNSKLKRLRGIKFFPMRCPSRGVTQLVHGCPQLAFVNQIVSQQNTLSDLPQDLEPYHGIIHQMFSKISGLSLKNIRHGRYSKLRALDIKITDPVFDLANFKGQLIRSLNLIGSDLRIRETVTDPEEIERIKGIRPANLKKCLNWNENIGYKRLLDELIKSKKNLETTSAYADGTSSLIALETHLQKQGVAPDALSLVRSFIVYTSVLDEESFDNPGNVRRLKKIGKKLAFIEQMYFLRQTQASTSGGSWSAIASVLGMPSSSGATASVTSTNKFNENFFNRDMRSLTRLLEAIKKTGEEEEVDEGKISFSFSEEQDKELFLDVSDYKTVFSNPERFPSIKLGICFQEKGRDGEPEEKYTKFTDFSLFPTDNKTEYLSTFSVDPNGIYLDIDNGKLLNEKFKYIHEGELQNLFGKMKERATKNLNGTSTSSASEGGSVKEQSHKNTPFVYIYTDNSKKKYEDYWFIE